MMEVNTIREKEKTDNGNNMDNRESVDSEMETDDGAASKVKEEDIKLEIKEESVDEDDDERINFALKAEESASTHFSDFVLKQEAGIGIGLEYDSEMITISRSGRLIKKLFPSPSPSRRKTPNKQKCTKITQPSQPSHATVAPVSSDQHNCLLCFKETDDYIINMFPNAIEHDFQVMFILRKMLNVPKESLMDYLTHLEHPRKWIAVCSTCTVVVNKAFVIQTEINRLEETLRKCQGEMIQKIKKTEKKRAIENSRVLSRGNVCRVTNETREFVVTGRVTTTTGSHLAQLTPTPKPNASNAYVLKKDRKRRSRNTTRTRQMRYRRALKANRVRELLESKLKLQVESVNAPSKDNPEPPTIEVNLNAPLLPIISIPHKKQRRPKRKMSKVTVDTVCKSDDIDIVALRKTTYKCSLCPNLKDMNSTLFSSHVLFHQNRPYRCSECHLYFSGNKLELETCPINTLRKKNNEQHICSSSSLIETKFKPGNIWNCEYCDQTFNLDSERDSHENFCNLQRGKADLIVLKNSCSICEKKFRNIAEWRIHMALEHPQIAALSCFYCDETFLAKIKEKTDLLDYEKMKSHLHKCHTIDKFSTRMVYPCDFCGEVFSGISILSEHVEAVHQIHKNNTLSCGVCHFRTIYRASLLNHLKQIHCLNGARNYICEQCGFRTTGNIEFEHHNFTKHGIKPTKRPILKCSVVECNFQTVGNVRLKRHMMKVHDAPRKLTCHICGKGFLRSCHLNRHKQIHLNKNDKPFQCEICGNSFAVQNYLYIHMRLSHQNRPFASTHKRKPSRKKNNQVTSNINNISYDERDVDADGLTAPVPTQQALPVLNLPTSNDSSTNAVNLPVSYDGMSDKSVLI